MSQSGLMVKAGVDPTRATAEGAAGKEALGSANMAL